MMTKLPKYIPTPISRPRTLFRLDVSRLNGQSWKHYLRLNVETFVICHKTSLRSILVISHFVSPLCGWQRNREKKHYPNNLTVAAALTKKQVIHIEEDMTDAKL